MWENSDFRIRLKENSIAEHEKIMLSSGQCEIFMPMGFLGDEEGVIASYDCSGFAPLSGYRIESTEDALYLLERTLIILGNAVQYFITPAKVMLTTNTVFYNRDTGQVKIAYVPLGGEDVDLKQNIVAFIEQLKADLRDGREDFLTQASRYIYYKNYYINDIITKVALMKRQIYAEEAKRRSLR